MQTQSLKINIWTILVFVYFIFVFLTVIFSDDIVKFANESSTVIADTQQSSGEITKSLNSLSKLTFNTEVLKSDYIQSISILPTYPTDARAISNFGKNNPFLGGFTVISTPAQNGTSTVGGATYSTQRTSDTGIGRVNTQRNNTPTRR